MSINAENLFYIIKGIMTLEETKKLSNDREFLDYSLLIGDTTEDQLYKQIEVEIGLYHKCRAVIKKEKQKKKHTKSLTLMLLDRINNMFAYMFHLFPINNEYAWKYVKFCSNHILPVIAPYFRCKI